MSNLTFWFCVMYHSYNVTSQLGPCLWHTLDDGTCMSVVINGDHAIPPKICSKENFFHLKVCQGHLYTLYYNTTFSFQSDKLWSFHGLLLHGDHQQIHMRWMINYNVNSIQHLSLF
jgi:hypothetical protein